MTKRTRRMKKNRFHHALFGVMWASVVMATVGVWAAVEAGTGFMGGAMAIACAAALIFARGQFREAMRLHRIISEEAHWDKVRAIRYSETDLSAPASPAHSLNRNAHPTTQGLGG